MMKRLVVTLLFIVRARRWTMLPFSSRRRTLPMRCVSLAVSVSLIRLLTSWSGMLRFRIRVTMLLCSLLIVLIGRRRSRGALMSSLPLRRPLTLAMRPALSKRAICPPLTRLSNRRVLLKSRLNLLTCRSLVTRMNSRRSLTFVRRALVVVSLITRRLTRHRLHVYRS